MGPAVEATPKEVESARTMPRHIRVLVCEDDVRVRNTLARVIESQRDFQLVASVESGEEAIEAVAANGAPDVILLDVHLPGIDGIETLRRLRAGGVESPALVLSADDRAAARLADIADAAFLSKGTSSALQVVEELRARAGRSA